MAKTISFVLIAILSISLFLGMGVSSATERSYSIPYIDMDLHLQTDGTLHVKETIHYSFSGTYNGVYRDIPIRDQAKLENIKISTPGIYSNYTITDQGSNKHITIYLYSDPAKTIPISNRDVDVVIEYDFWNVIRFYNDMAELQYKLVGEGWAVDVEQLNARIHVESNEGVQYVLTPQNAILKSAWQGNTLEITSKVIQPGQFFEVRMVMPKSQFMTDPPNVLYVNQNITPEIEKVQNDYQNFFNFGGTFYQLISIIIILMCFIPLIIYLIYGREPKIDYNAEYERDLPTDDPPAIVNAICGKSSKKVGYPDIDGFKATIMDLIDRNYLILMDASLDGQDSDSHVIFLEINPDSDLNELWDFELEVFNFLREYEEDGVISLDVVSESLSYINNVAFFNETYTNWVNGVRQALSDGKLEEAFLRKGDKYIKFFGIFGLVIAGMAFLYTFRIMDPVPAVGHVRIASLVLAVVAVISIIIPDKIGGRWTDYGMEYYLKWNNFKKFVKDFSLIKEYPPESVEIWNRYLVYATALGAANGVKKAMELTLPRSILSESDMYVFQYFSPTALLSEALKTALDSD